MEKTCCKKKYKLVLMDLNMPIMDGYDSTVQILQSFNAKHPSGVYENGSRVYVVAVTAFVNEENVNKCYQVGMVDVIHKPLSNDDLERVLQKYFFY